MAAEGEAEASLQVAPAPTATELEVLPEKATENVTGPSRSETASQEPSEVETARGPSKTTGAVNKAIDLGLIQDIVYNRPDSFMLQDLIIARQASTQGL